MTAETSNARWEWVLVPRELLEAAVCPMKESGCDGTQYPVQPYGEGEQCQWCCERRASLTAPPPAAAEPKTLPVPTRVYLTDKAAVIVGDPQRGWDEEGPEAHNCDDMGCSTIGPHVLARVPFTDERALSQPAEAQGDGDLNISMLVRDGTWVGTYAEWCRRKQIPPPSAPVGVEAIAAEIRASLGGGATVCTRRRWAIELEALAQQPAAPSGEAGAFDANFLQSVASLCRAAYDLCQPKPQRTPEDPREHYGELCLLELTSIADEIERRLAAAEGVQPEESRSVAHQLLHWGGVPVHVTGTVTTSPGNWSLIDAAQHQEPES